MLAPWTPGHGSAIILPIAPKSLGVRPVSPRFPAHPGPALRYWFVMPIDDLQQAAQKIAGFLATLNKLGGMRLKYRISAGDGTPDPEGQAPALCVELGGPDVALATQHN